VLVRPFFPKEIAMTKASDRLMQWLRDAHAMEKQADQMLTGMANRIKNYPTLEARIQEHNRGDE
jgi:ferritin-like metal-binding protein YciE